ncbi:FdhF/YdeP family oxidoreductase [Rhizobium sp. BK399]|uniref:FdhF/YdeP family oxidoreductase n=1 Tax=Rhizobium sp. BK399 TaxID=2587063 RepID=UPI0016230EBF|nr:FdhF/YdeP family oxidoreductase [Rhizobium sp. BK399]MBB3543854.1 molybdopterin-dependent oxidoreductase alpha subunit [Rhizobium sp. BK399]
MTSRPQDKPHIGFDSGPAGGWGSAKSVTEIVLREHIPLSGPSLLRHQNKPEGYMCVSCAWAKPAKSHPLEFCENGAKATAWEVTSKRADETFFASHTLGELETWLDHDLEEQGRLTHPMRWDSASDKYIPVAWDTAFDEIGRELKQIAPEMVDFYTSGRASLETCYMYQLFARIFGSNNLPDSSNMCHESTSVGLPESIGATVGTAVLSDFQNCDCIFYIAQNVGTSSPRLLHDLQDAVHRGVKIVTFNLLREPGLERFINPQAPSEMITGSETPISSEYYQVRNGGDIAALFGVCKALIEADDAKQSLGLSKVAGSDGEARSESAAAVAFAAAMTAADKKHVLDHDFIKEHTSGFEAFATAARAHSWENLEGTSGLTREQMIAAARTYAESDAVVLVYGMGLTQQVMGVENIHMVANLALLRGNIGKPGANICAVRGHSNVQGQRTVGITEKPALVPLDKLAELYRFDPPRWEGRSTVDVCEAVLSGKSRAFVSLGGNFIRAVPDTKIMEAAWAKLRLTVQIATKLNRSHLIHGEIAYLLPCLGRLEIDQQATGPQAVSMESSVAHFHGSRGRVQPASPHLLSEPAIIAGLAKATLTRGIVPWDEWVADYSLIRDAIENTYPETFKKFNERLFQPGGFARPVPARERKWVTANKKANFITPSRLFPEFDISSVDDKVLNLATLRSNDQFNTTIYGYSDRFRGVDGTRQVVFLNGEDIERLGFKPGEFVDMTTAIEPEIVRSIQGFRIVEYDIPRGCCASYYPEANPLFPLGHHAPRAKTPSYKLLPIRLSRSDKVPVE